MNPGAELMRSQLSKIIPVPHRDSEINSYPMIDQLIVLDFDAEAALDRISGMRVDPTTGQIYDAIINPALEVDKKLVARLEPVTVDHDDLRDKILQFDDRSQSLPSYLERFGFEELKTPVLNVVDACTPLADTEKMIVDRVKAVVNLKYELYNSEVLPAHYRHLVLDETGSENQPDVSEKVESQRQYEGHTNLQPNFQSPQNNRPSMRDMFVPATTPQVIGSHGKLARGPSFYSASKGSFRKLDTMSMRSGGNRKEKLLSHGKETWEKIFVDYTGNLEKIIKDTKEIFHILDVHYENSQKVFGTIFREKREFHVPLISFVDGYRRLAADNPEVIKGEYCKKKLYAKVDSIHDQMWDEIEKSREQAVQEKDKMITKNLITADIQSLCRINLSLVAAEMNKLFHLR